MATSALTGMLLAPARAGDEPYAPRWEGQGHVSLQDPLIVPSTHLFLQFMSSTHYTQGTGEEQRNVGHAVPRTMANTDIHDIITLLHVEVFAN